MLWASVREQQNCQMKWNQNELTFELQAGIVLELRAGIVMLFSFNKSNYLFILMILKWIALLYIFRLVLK